VGGEGEGKHDNGVYESFDARVTKEDLSCIGVHLFCAKAGELSVDTSGLEHTNLSLSRGGVLNTGVNAGLRHLLLRQWNKVP
jgi:hypothetical protein